MKIHSSPPSIPDSSTSSHHAWQDLHEKAKGNLGNALLLPVIGAAAATGAFNFFSSKTKPYLAPFGFVAGVVAMPFLALFGLGQMIGAGALYVKSVFSPLHASLRGVDMMFPDKKD